MAWWMEVDPEPSTWTVCWRALVYLAINSAQPLLVDVMKYHGAASVSSFLYIMPTYFGMILVGAFNLSSVFQQSRSHWLTAFRLTSADLTHQLLEKAGLVFCGSAVYMVCSSTSIAFTALISHKLLKKKTSPLQWGGIVLIVVGLCSRVGQLDLTVLSWEVGGVILILSASALHALSYVWNEGALTGPNKIEGTQLVCMMGMISSGILTCWTAVYTLPQLSTLVFEPMRNKGGSMRVACACWLTLLLCAFARSMTLWYLLKHLGAVASGVIKGARAALVIVLSHAFFCSFDSVQCLSVNKSISAMICVSGVLTYSWASTGASVKKPELPTTTTSTAAADIEGGENVCCYDERQELLVSRATTAADQACAGNIAKSSSSSSTATDSCSTTYGTMKGFVNNKQRTTH
eukprot:GHVS01028887.1.p1 GENE.GHVS01028887.1~~GHVS01028887.1.p1  ORF type:complete len:405 (-),score=57.70 GHVS01028887.1:414-1628(-)